MHIVAVALLFSMVIIVNLYNIGNMIKDAYGRGYILKTIQPSIYGLLFYVAYMVLSKTTSIYPDGMEYFMIFSWFLLTVVFATITSIITLIKMTLYKEFENLELLIAYIVVSIIYFPASVMILVPIIFTWVKVTEKPKKKMAYRICR